jgi:CRISPR type III-B/RAMP module RAMP protein Cmr6
MAGGVQENAGIALDRCFGLPLIPGSAIKGVARHTALWEIRSCEDPSEKQRLLTLALFVFGYVADDLKPHAKHTNWHWAAGDQAMLSRSLAALPSQKDFKGIVSFLPASPADAHVRIVAEGITPHTDEQGKEKDPTVLTFPAVERGSSFGFALVLNRRCETGAESLAQAALWVKSAITGTGIGAKTAAGFGWFVIDEAAETRLKQQAEKEAATAAKKAEESRIEADRIAAEKAVLDAMTDLERHLAEIEAMSDDSFAAKAKQAAEGGLEGDELTAFFSVLQSDAKKDRRKQWRKKKPDLWAQLTAAAAKEGITLN